MKNLSIFFVLLSLIGIPSIALSQGYALFPQESLNNLMLIAIDSETSSFVVTNKNGEQVTGYIGDFLGYQEAEVVKVTSKHVTIQTIEFIVNENGNQHEQPSRMRIPLSFGLNGHGKGSR